MIREMNTVPEVAIALTVAALSLLPSARAQRAGIDWPSFRGPRASGVAEGIPTPLHWDVKSGRNIRWKTPIPGLAHSSPIVWGDRLYLTSAVGAGEAELKIGLYGAIAPIDEEVVHRFLVYCLDKNSGAILWQRLAHEGVPRVKRHPKSSHASSTPATDGKHIVAFFGSEGLYCYDAGGKLLWKKDLGLLDAGFYLVPRAQWGFGSSPIIHAGLAIVQCDVQKDSFLAAFALADGREVWRTSREEVPTWSTPTVAPRGEGVQVIANGFKHIGGYDARSGEELWWLRGGGDIPVPTPVLGGGAVFITSAHGGAAPIYAVDLNAVGEVSAESAALRWSHRRRGNYIPTPLYLGGRLYCANDRGILSCLDASSGEVLYRQRLGSGQGGFSASPVAADGKLYITSEEGEVYIVRAGPKFELLARNEMGSSCMASPAISSGMLFFRTRDQVIAVGADSRDD